MAGRSLVEDAGFVFGFMALLVVASLVLGVISAVDALFIVFAVSVIAILGAVAIGAVSLFRSRRREGP